MNIIRDLSVAFRVLSRRPSFSVPAIVTLALGIGANVAVFAAVQAVLIDRVPYKDAADLLALKPADHFRGLPATVADIEALEKLAAFNNVAGCTLTEASALRARPTVLTSPLAVTAGFFTLWGVAPHIGRVLSGEDFTSGARNAVVSFDMWRTLLARNPQPVGQTIVLNRQAWTIVGVMPPGFAPPCYDTGRAAQAWIPLSSTPPASGDALTVVARLEQGVTIAVAQSQVDSVTARLATERGDSRYEHAYLEPVGASAAAELQPGLFLLQGVALLLLLITCANLGNLFLVHTTARYGEFAVRAGLGARPIDLLRHVFAEAGIIATAGAALGVAVAYVTSAWLRSIAAPVLPQWISVQIDLTDLTVGLGIGWITAVAFGTVPAVLAARIGAPNTTRQSATQTTSGAFVRRLRESLVAAQVLMAVVLLAGAGLLIRSFINIMNVPVGFDVRGLVTTDLYLDTAASGVRDTARQLDDEIRRMGPSWAVAFADTSPFVSGGGRRWRMRLPDAAEFVPRSFHAKRVSPNYLEVMRIPLLRGRPLSSFEGHTSPLPAVASAAFARTLGQGREVIGAELRSDDRSYVIVGVAGDVKTVWLGESSAAEIYVPIDSGADSPLSVVIRTDNEPRARRALAETAARINPNGPPVAAESMASIVARSEQRRWFYSVLVSLFAFLSVAVSIVGVSGAVAQVVALRSREMGIRVALGACPSTVVWLVMRQGLRPATLGVLAGAVAAWWTGRVLQANSLFQSLMFQVSPADPWPFALVAVAVVAVSLLAAWAPARLVVRSNPATALREL